MSSDNVHESEKRHAEKTGIVSFQPISRDRIRGLGGSRFFLGVDADDSGRTAEIASEIQIKSTPPHKPTFSSATNSAPRLQQLEGSRGY